MNTVALSIVGLAILAQGSYLIGKRPLVTLGWVAACSSAMFMIAQ